MLKVYLVQMEAVLNNKTANFRKVRELLSAAGCMPSANTASKTPADFAKCECQGLIILPEMFATGYIPEDPARYAEDFSCATAGETANFLSELSSETGCAVLGAGISLADASQLHNHASLYLPGNPQEAAFYNKRKPFFPEVNFKPGESVSLFKINQWNIAAAICYDLRFPELFRDATKAGAKLITVQAAWPLVRKEHWITLLKARAIENQVYIAAVNQVGGSPLQLGGNSMIISPTGEIISDITNSIKTDINSCEGVIQSTILSVPQDEYRKAFPVLNGIV